MSGIFGEKKIVKYAKTIKFPPPQKKIAFSGYFAKQINAV